MKIYNGVVHTPGWFARGGSLHTQFQFNCDDCKQGPFTGSGSQKLCKPCARARIIAYDRERNKLGDRKKK